MLPDVTVVTPWMRGREELLAEAEKSVGEQTVLPVMHLIQEDTWNEGPAIIRNRMLHQVETPWVAFLDDDDLLDPEHIETLLLETMAADSDVTWSWCRTTGERAPVIPRPTQFNSDDLRQANYIPVTTVVNTDAAMSVGGFDASNLNEDWGLWLRMLAAGARFSVVPEVTWTYRFHDTNRSYKFWPA
jgi:Glycosyl transferase family 2